MGRDTTVERDHQHPLYLHACGRHRHLRRGAGNAQTLEIIFDVPEAPPAWTALEFEQCKHCPLAASEVSHCPLALSLDRLVRTCGRLLSYEAMDARVDMPEQDHPETDHGAEGH